jgi:signal transduction histidine kinase
VNDLLDLQRLEAGRQPLVIEPIHLSYWLPNLVNSFQERARSRHQHLVLQMPDPLPPILADPNALRRILAELLHNACKYTPPQQQIVMQVEAQATAIQWHVTNYGTEIPVDELPHIFKKFYRVIGTDQWQQGGTGLGLALVKKLVDHMGGTIAVSSTPGQTTFTLTLPSAIPD